MAGRKTFVAGEILTASDVNVFLQNQVVQVYDDAAERTTALPSPLEGQVTYRKDEKTVEVFDGTAFGPIGTILQVVSTAKTDTFSASVVANASTSITGLEATITPTSTSSKIIVLVSAVGGYSTGTVEATLAISLKRDSTDIAIPSSVGSRKAVTSISRILSSANGNIVNVVGQFLDSPNTSSAVTYSVDAHNTRVGATTTIYINRAADDADTTSVPRPVSTITLMEVAG